MKKIINIILTVIALLSGLAMLAGAYGGLVEPSMTFKGRVAPLMVMTFPYMMAVCLCVLVASLLLRSKAWIVTMVSYLACAPAVLNIMPMRLASKPNQEEMSRAFTLLTFNVMDCEDWGLKTAGLPYGDGNRIIDYIIATDADIVCLQESYRLPPAGWRGATNEQNHQINQMYPYIERWQWGWLTIMSKYPLTRLDMGNAPHSYDYHFFAGATAHISVGGAETDVNIINAHLQPIGLTSNDKQVYHDITQGEETRSNLSRLKNGALLKLSEAFISRAKQSTQIADYIKAHEMPTIVCGDFNDVPLSYAVRVLKDVGMHEVYPLTMFIPHNTYQANRFYFRIDHILYRGPFEAVSLKIPNTDISDHKPQIVTFVLDSPK